MHETVLCPRCEAHVPSNNIRLHELRCQGQQRDHGVSPFTYEASPVAITGGGVGGSCTASVLAHHPHEILSRVLSPDVREEVRTWQCKLCTYENPVSLCFCEICEAPCGSGRSCPGNASSFFGLIAAEEQTSHGNAGDMASDQPLDRLFGLEQEANSFLATLRESEQQSSLVFGDGIPPTPYSVTSSSLPSSQRQPDSEMSVNMEHDGATSRNSEHESSILPWLPRSLNPESELEGAEVDVSVDGLGLSVLVASLQDLDGLSAGPTLQSIISALPTHIVRADEFSATLPEQRSCSICIEDFIEGEDRRTLPCFHHFHCLCIDPWLRQRGCCPICRHPVGLAFQDLTA